MPTVTSTPRSPRQRAAVAVAWLIGGLVFLLALAWFGIPPLARWQIEAQGTAMLGRAVTVEKVGFIPWQLRTNLEGLEIAGPSGAAGPLLRVEHVGFRTALSSLWELAPVIEELSIDSPRLRLTRLAAGRYDIDDLIDRFSTPADPDRPPARYVLRNLKLSSGAIDFEDRATAGKPLAHTVRDLQLALPAISSLDGDRASEVAPTLAFTLDGSRFDSSAEGLPYAELRKGEATLHFDKLDLARLHGYWPATLPLRPESGLVDGRLKFAFVQNAAPAAAVLEMSGDLSFDGLSLLGPDGREALRADSVKVGITRLAPLQQQLSLQRIEIVKPRLKVSRDAQGRIDLMPPANAAAPTAKPAPPWSLALARLVVSDGGIDWGDAAGAVPVQMAVQALQLDVAGVAWPMVRPAEMHGSADLQQPGSNVSGKLSWSGSASLEKGRLALKAQSFPLAWAQPYMEGLQASLGGTLGAEATVAWSPAGVLVEAANVSLENPALLRDKTTLLGSRRVVVNDARIDTTQRSIAIAGLDISAPVGQVSRDAKGRFMFTDWWKAPAAGPAAPAEVPPAAPWRLALKSLKTQGGQLGWRDAVPARPVALDLSALNLQATDLAWPLPPGNRGFPLQLDTTVAAGQTTAGTLRFKGTLAPDPLVLDGRLDVARLPVQRLEPYFGDAFNVQLVRADLGFAGAVRLALLPAGLELKLQGNIDIDNGRIDSATPDVPSASPGPVVRTGGVLTPGARRASSLFTWRTLQFRTAALKLAPGKPLFWGVYDTTLGDFFARLAINENGRLNLRELTRAPAGGAPSTDPRKPPDAADPPELHFGETHLVNGRVQFTDNFIKPSYSLALSELEGVIGAFDSVGAVYTEPAMATVSLRGKAEGSAALEINGKLNALANPLAVDVVTKVTDLDLPSLSPYSVKYAGYGIQRGKLSMEAHYRIQPDGRLDATNSLVLRQLVFDEQADGARSNLPVRLAAALLADSNGVIDLNLPISGSLNDPQFSIGPVIGRALLNLFSRILTSPFSLLKSAFATSAGSSETAVVPFVAGSSDLSPGARKDLDGIAQALAQKSSLQITVTGVANTALEADGFRKERLRQLAQFEKRRAIVAAAPTATAPPAAQLTVSAAEYPALLKKVYAATDMPKPRNLIGMAKDLPVDEMERLLAGQVDVTDESIRGLALQRGAAVRDYLAARGVPVSRVFLGAVRMEEKPPADWQPQARLRLSIN
jgi:hypothetical protein